MSNQNPKSQGQHGTTDERGRKQPMQNPSHQRGRDDDDKSQGMPKSGGHSGSGGTSNPSGGHKSR